MSRDQYSSRGGRSHRQGRYSAFRATTTGGFIRVDRAVARALGGIDAAALFHELAWRSEEDYFTDADGWIDVSVAELEESTTLTRRQQDRVRKSLTEMGVIITKREGIPPRMLYQIDWEEIEDRVAILGEVGHRSRENARSSQLHQTVQTDAPNRANNGTEGDPTLAPNGASYIREKKPKEVKQRSPQVKEISPMWERLDPEADADLILRNRFDRPELPPPTSGLPMKTLEAWNKIQREWDSKYRR